MNMNKGSELTQKSVSYCWTVCEIRN